MRLLFQSDVASSAFLSTAVEGGGVAVARPLSGRMGDLSFLRALVGLWTEFGVFAFEFLAAVCPEGASNDLNFISRDFLTFSGMEDKYFQHWLPISL